MADDAYPYRNVNTGLVQQLTEDQAAIFPGAFEKLADDYDAVLAAQDEAHAALEAAKADGTKAEVKAAQADVKTADEAAASAVVTPAEETPAETPKES